MFHTWIALGIFVLLSLAGILLAFLGIGGTFVIATSAIIYDLITWSWTISLMLIIILLGIAILGELLEWALTAITAKTKGVSGWGTAGAFIGAITGSIFLSPAFPLIGTIIGFVLGAMLGAFILELMHTGKAGKAFTAAKAALLGRVLVSLAKTLLAIIQIILITKSIF